MNPEQQRHAIHEFLGWKKVYEGPIHYAWRREDEFHYLNCEPNYLSDLNAMHEAEKTLTVEQQDIYACYLSYIVMPCGVNRGFTHLHATSDQRAEAFLRTLNLWTSQ